MAIGLSVKMICCGPHLQLLAATPCFRAMHVPQGTADAGPFAGPYHIGFDALDGVRLRVDTVRPASAEISTCNPAQSLRPPRQASRKPRSRHLASIRSRDYPGPERQSQVSRPSAAPSRLRNDKGPTLGPREPWQLITSKGNPERIEPWNVTSNPHRSTTK